MSLKYIRVTLENQRLDFYRLNLYKQNHMNNYLKSIMSFFASFFYTPSHGAMDKQIEDFIRSIPPVEQERTKYLLSYRQQVASTMAKADLVILDRIIFEFLPTDEQRRFNNKHKRSFRPIEDIIGRAVQYMIKGNFDIAYKILSEQYNILKKLYTDSESVEYHVFDTSLEESLFEKIVLPCKKVLLLPENYGLFYRTYASVLHEMKQYNSALEAFKTSLRYNPVSCATYTELCELYKERNMFQEMMDASQYALQFAATKEQIARFYRNIAYSLENWKRYREALVLHYLSMELSDSDFSLYAIGGLSEILGKDNSEPPTSTEIQNVLKQNHIPEYPSPLVISEALGQADLALEHNMNELAIYFLSLVYELTDSEDVMNRIKSISV